MVRVVEYVRKKVIVHVFNHGPLTCHRSMVKTLMSVRFDTRLTDWTWAYWVRI